MDQRPIGVFDSGLGGASVLRAALQMLPSENYIYYGDNLNAPYGDRTEADITRLTLDATRKLMARDIKALLIACNTATGTCIQQLRDEFAIPVISIEPAIKPACALPGDGKVLMMATKATTCLERYLALQARMPDPSRVINIPCPGIVERIEAGIFDDDGFDDLFDGYLSTYEGLDVDAIVLGCTHYPFIKGAFHRNAAKHLTGTCRLFDGSEGTVRQLRRVLIENHLESTQGRADVRFCTSGDIKRIQPVFDMLIRKQR